MFFAPKIIYSRELTFHISDYTLEAVRFFGVRLRCKLSIPKEIKTPSIFSKYPWLPVYLMVLVVLLVWGAIAFSGTPAEYQTARQNQETGVGLVAHLTEPWRHWDTPYYLMIAKNWYRPGGPELSFPPLYPVLIGILGRIIGGNYLPAALIISWVSTFAACILLVQTYRDYTDEPTTQRAVKYLLLFPTAFFLFAGYTESLFLVFSLLSWQGAKNGVWWQAGVFGLLASFTRFIGVYLLAAYAWMWLKAPRKQKGTIAAWLAPIPIALVGWFWLTQYYYEISPSTAVLNFWYLQTAWPWEGILNSIRYLVEQPDFFNQVYIYPDVLVVFLFGWAILWAAKRKWWPEAIFMGITLGSYLIKVLESGLLISTSRYVLVLFPGFILLAEWGKNRWFDRLWSVGSFLYMLFLATFFFVGK